MIYIVYNSETKKLLENDYKTEKLEREKKLITRTCGVGAYVICINFVDLAHKKIIIEKIRAKNIGSILGREIKENK